MHTPSQPPARPELTPEQRAAVREALEAPAPAAEPPAPQPLAAGGQGTRNHHSGTAGGQPVLVDVTFLGVIGVRIQLTQAWTTAREPGYPSRPSLTGTAAGNLDFPKTIAAGTVMEVMQPEAQALVAMGAAVYV
jgi:hypothetical protein